MQTPGLGPPKTLYAGSEGLGEERRGEGGLGSLGGTRQAGKQMRAFQSFKRALTGWGPGTGDCQATSSA